MQTCSVTSSALKQDVGARKCHEKTLKYSLIRFIPHVRREELSISVVGQCVQTGELALC